MNCECKEQLEAQLTERFSSNTPASKGHRVTLQGYGLSIQDNTVKLVGMMEYQTYALVPLKSGGSKPQKKKGSMCFSFCPFCGVSVAAPQGDTPCDPAVLA